jgi:hypothetical protein
VFASLPFDRETIEWLSQRTQCFLKAREAYQDVYETYEFDGRLQWYDTGANKEYDDQADRDKLARLIDDTPPLTTTDEPNSTSSMPGRSPGSSFPRKSCPDPETCEPSAISS